MSRGGNRATGKGKQGRGKQDTEEEFAGSTYILMKVYVCKLVPCSVKNNKAEQLKIKTFF